VFHTRKAEVVTRKNEKELGTRERLLEAAGRVFAQKGYRDATIAGICKQARANIAAVNYHFGGKRKLYVAVWHHLFHESLKRYPPEGGVPESAPPEERLAGRVGSLIRRVLSRDNSFTIMEQELGDPTGLLEGPIKKAITPLRTRMLELVSELLGEGATERQIEFCVMSIMSQCMALRHRMRMRKPPHARKWLTPSGIHKLAEHITQFSLGGIREVRRQIKSAQRH